MIMTVRSLNRMTIRIQEKKGTGEIEGMMQALVTRMEAICANCPDFLLPSVLEGVLGEITANLTKEELNEAAFLLQDVRGVRNKDGFALGLKALIACANEGPTAFFTRLKAMPDFEVSLWRNDA